MDYVTPEDKQMMIDDVADLMADEETQVPITYKVFSSRGTYSPTTGLVTETYTPNLSINTFRFPITEKEMRESGGAYQLGDYRYLIATADLAMPKKDDRILDGAITRYPFEWSTDPLNLFHALVARKL